MGNLIAACIAFVGTHFLLSHPLRGALVARMGERPFQGLYSVVALGTFAWIVFAFMAAPPGAYLWGAGDGLWLFATLLMLLGSILFGGSLVRNPALPAPGAEKLASQPARGVFAITRHPMMWGFAIWAVVHVLVAPREPVIILSLAIIILAIGGSMGQDAKKARLMGESWRDWASRTSFVPFAGQFSGRIPWMSPGAHALGSGVVIWLLATWLHPVLGGPIAGIWRWIG